ncbi:unnamed protein product [Notodromas monacha]|uniref:Elongation of very long chain fatty acids protein n=1 Tax=Notodromas monacha TaxID=399045 RepID=A0A7R9BIX6_9CRUS|nr:unnamed protein product [Notodromas monacha]CAG0915462.1 unnamed protein product [Notodromas monacha]
MNVTEELMATAAAAAQCPAKPPVYLVSKFEGEFTCTAALVYVVKFWWLPWVSVALYLASVALGMRLMKARGKPFDLRNALVAWNTGLAVFSICGSLRMVALLELVYDKGMRFALMHEGYAQCRGQCMWAILFLLSKFVELGDTAFIVLRRRPVTFLHVYHHSTVLVFTYWMGSITTSGLLPQYMAINYFIHSIMYSYYACMAYGIRVPKPIAIGITCAQIAQMFYGVYVTAAFYQYTKATGMPLELRVACCVYASYALLFIRFFVNAYLRNNGRLTSAALGNNSKNNGVVTMNNNNSKKTAAAAAGEGKTNQVNGTWKVAIVNGNKKAQ